MSSPVFRRTPITSGVADRHPGRGCAGPDARRASLSCPSSPTCSCSPHRNSTRRGPGRRRGVRPDQRLVAGEDRPTAGPAGRRHRRPRGVRGRAGHGVLRRRRPPARRRIPHLRAHPRLPAPGTAARPARARGRVHPDPTHRGATWESAQPFRSHRGPRDLRHGTGRGLRARHHPARSTHHRPGTPPRPRPQRPGGRGVTGRGFPAAAHRRTRPDPGDPRHLAR